MSSIIAATGAFALVATTENPFGAAATKSPWLAQTRISGGTPANSGAESVHRDQRVAELALARGRDRPAERVRHQLHAVADPEHGDADVENGGIALRRAGVGHALGPAGQDDPGRTPRANLLGRGVRRPDLRVHRELAKPPGDELCVLRPEVENDDCLVAHRNDPPGASRRSGAISRYYSGVATRLTTICCSALALITALTGLSSAQTRRVKQTYAADDRTPLPLFPLQTLWTLALNNSLTATPGLRRDARLLPARRRSARRVQPRDRGHGSGSPRSTPRSSRPPATTSCSWSGPAACRRSAPPTARPRGNCRSPRWSRSLRCGTTAGSSWRRPATTSWPSAPPTARLLWRRNVGAVAHARPALAGEYVYLPGSDSRVVAMRVDTGALVWERRLGGAANEILVSGDRLYLGSQDRFFYCLNAEDGEVEWRWQTGGPVIGLPVVDDRTAYFVSLDNVLQGPEQVERRAALENPLAAASCDRAAARGRIDPRLRTCADAAGLPRAGRQSRGRVRSRRVNWRLPPHLFTPVSRAFPVVIAVARDIVKGVTVVALGHSFDPAIAPLTPAAGPDPDEPDGDTPGPAGAVAAGAIVPTEVPMRPRPASRRSAPRGIPAVERQVRTRCRETDVLEGEPSQDERHQLQRHHREADERHERDQARRPTTRAPRRASRRRPGRG